MCGMPRPTFARALSDTVRRRGPRAWRVAALLAALTVGAGAQIRTAAAQTAAPGNGSGGAGVAQEIAAMRQELARLRAEVDALKQALGSRTAEPGTPGAPGAPATPGAAQAAATPVDTAAAVSVLQTQVQELAQVKVESDSRLPIKIFGTILSNTFFNSDEANWLENPNIVNRFGGITGRPGSFSSTLRQSRIGLAINGPDVGGAKASGRVIVDFFGGTPAFNTGQVMGLPRLLYAFARIDGEKTALEVGQDHMMLAPRDPTSLAALSFPDLFRSGNLYLRVPQARVERKFGGVTVMGGIVAPIAGDFEEDFYVFVPPAGAGERSKMPAVQAHVGYKSGDDESRQFAIGFSGHYGRERVGNVNEKSYAGAVDFNLQGGRIGAAGEFFFGENIDQFGGSINQNAKSAGGWAEARFKMTDRFSVNGGFGIDKLPDDEFITLGRRENRSIFGNVIFKLTPEVSTSVEYRFLSTLFRLDDRHENHHVNWVFSYTF
jgi:hypothetical protein